MAPACAEVSIGNSVVFPVAANASGEAVGTPAYLELLLVEYGYRDSE